MLNCVTSCWPCTRKNSARWKRLWRQKGNEVQWIEFLERSAACCRYRGNALRDISCGRGTCAGRKCHPRPSFERFSEDGDTRGRPVGARRAQVWRRAAARGNGPRREDRSDDSRAGELARRGAIFRRQNPNRGAANGGGGAHQDRISRGRKEVVPLRQEHFLLGQLRHCYAL